MRSFPLELHGEFMFAHIVFGKSAAFALRRVLLQHQPDGLVICINDNYAIGPIGCEIRSRESWLENVYGCSLSPTLSAEEKLWHSAVVLPRLMIWMSSRSARELSGLCELNRRQRLAAMSTLSVVVDFAEIELSKSGDEKQVETRMSFSMANEKQIEDVLLSRQGELVDSDGLASDWDRLIAEASVLRVVEHSKLKSAPLSFFDGLLVSRCGSQWTPVNRVVADALYTSGNGGDSQTTFDFLIARVNALIASSLLSFRECRSVAEIRRSKSAS